MTRYSFSTVLSFSIKEDNFDGKFWKLTFVYSIWTLLEIEVLEFLFIQVHET